MVLQVLIVDDDKDYLAALTSDLQDFFKQSGTNVTAHPCSNFDEALTLLNDPLRRYDLIISDTYDGSPANDEARVIQMVLQYRDTGRRFCPIIVYSSAPKPPELHTTDFIKWADKSKPNGIELAVGDILQTGVPQISRTLHDELDKLAGSFLWEFLEANWKRLSADGGLSSDTLERLIRRRAAIQIGDITSDGKGNVPIMERVSSEYYIYPSMINQNYNLGDILRNRENQDDFRVILTPHCHLFKQPGKERPRADFVLTLKTVPAKDILGNKITDTANKPEEAARHKKLKAWSRSPSQIDTTPEGRHWYLPEFMDIPHLYGDFLQVESIPITAMNKYEVIATLVAPYAEAMQACFVSFYGSVGIPELKPDSIVSLLR